jgi:hypothetical protein
MNKALEDVAAERQRQISVEGWTPEHDDQHGDMSLRAAAACYAARHLMSSELRGDDGAPADDREIVPSVWPLEWSVKWWKPKDDRRNLVRAAALLLAEIERIDRLPPSRGDQHGS